MHQSAFPRRSHCFFNAQTCTQAAILRGQRHGMSSSCKQKQAKRNRDSKSGSEIEKRNREAKSGGQIAKRNREAKSGAEIGRRTREAKSGGELPSNRSGPPSHHHMNFNSGICVKGAHEIGPPKKSRKTYIIIIFIIMLLLF